MDQEGVLEGLGTSGLLGGEAVGVAHGFQTGDHIVDDSFDLFDLLDFGLEGLHVHELLVTGHLLVVRLEVHSGVEQEL